MHSSPPPVVPPPVPPSPGGTARRRVRGRQLRLSPPSGERPAARSRAGAVAVLLHVVAGGVLLQLLTFGHGLRWLTGDTDEAPRQERLTYVEPTPRPTPRAVRPTASAPSQGGAPSIQPPAAIPSAIPVPPKGDTGSAPRVRADGGIGAAPAEVRGVRPDYADPRVWQAPVTGYGLERRDGADNLDSIMAYAITAARDSLDSLARAQGRAGHGRAPGDWTRTDKNGNRWGWDQQGIRLGKVTIPNALLGLLPLNARVGASGNYTAMERERRVSAARDDILRMSDRSMGEAEFRRVLKEMNARRDVERRDRLRAPSASVAAPVRPDGKAPAP